MGKYALLIGVGEYGEGLQPLPAAPLDVAALAQVLQNPDIGGFDDVQQLANPSQPEMARAIELWFSARQPEDLVLLFFSGHGVKDDRRDLYFAARNTEKFKNRLLTATAIPAEFIHKCSRNCKARQQVIILDCCFSGAFGELTAKDGGEIDLESQLGAKGRVVLASTSAVDYSFEDKGAELSIYTRYLVEGLKTGAADADGDGVISVDELHRYISRKVAESSPAMTPKIIILESEGYRIALAHSSQNNSWLQDRIEVAQAMQRSYSQDIPNVNQAITAFPFLNWQIAAPKGRHQEKTRENEYQSPYLSNFLGRYFRFRKKAWKIQVSLALLGIFYSAFAARYLLKHFQEFMTNLLKAN